MNNKVCEEIAQERNRQIEEEGYTTDHDDRHNRGSLGMAAACLAAPLRLYQRVELAAGVHFTDAYPWSPADKRVVKKDGYEFSFDIPYEVRRRELIKAGALIVAEIERLDRANTSNK